MTKSMVLTFLFLVAFAFPARAQILGQPQGMGMPVAGAAVDPNYAAWSSGQYMLAQPCQYGGTTFDPIEDDDGVVEAKQAGDDAKEALHDARVALLEAKRKQREARLGLQKNLSPNVNVDELMATYKVCKTFSETFPLSAVTEKDGKVHEAGSKDLLTYSLKASQGFANGDSQAQCSFALEGKMEAAQKDMQDLCVMENAGTLKADFGGTGGQNTTDTKYQGCRDNFDKYRKATSEVDDLDKKVKEARAAITQSTKDLRAAKRDAQKLAKEEAELDREEGLDASTVGCPQCERAKKTKIDKTPLVLGLALGGGEILAQSLVNVANGRRNARLGYPTGPNPYASAIGAGFPFIYGGIYGAGYGGMTTGGYGCSPTAAGGMWGGGPWAGGGYAGMGYPYGGGMYMPGYGPSGYAGPWGVGAGAGVGVPMQMGYPMPMGQYPGAGIYAGAGIGAAGVPMMGPYGPYGPGAGIYAGAGIGAGGIPGVGGYGMGGPYGPFGPFGPGAGIGAGIGAGGIPGMGGYGLPGMGGYGMGGVPGIGGMGIGGMGMGMGLPGMSGFGLPGMGGMGGDYYFQQLQQQAQAMQDYSRRLQVYTQTIQQAYQLQTQAYSYLNGSSGMGSLGVSGGIQFGVGGSAGINSGGVVAPISAGGR